MLSIVAAAMYVANCISQKMGQRVWARHEKRFLTLISETKVAGSEAWQREVPSWVWWRRHDEQLG